MSEKPLVSVIIPVYKVEPYLYDCVDSVITQTYTNIEIILVDDGSPDSCPSICDEYAAKDSRVCVIHKKNGGLSDARNAGMKIAKGDWWTFVDSDDVIHPQMIEILMNPIIENSELKISTCSYQMVAQDYCKKDLIKTIETTSQGNIISFKNFVNISLWGTAWRKVYAKELFRNVEYPILRYYEDDFVIYKLLFEAKNIFYIDEPLYLYRQRKTSIMSKLSLKHIKDGCDCYIETINFFEEKNEHFFYQYFLISAINYFLKFYLPNYKDLVSKEFRNLYEQKLKSYSLKKLSFYGKLNVILKFSFPFVFKNKYRDVYSEGKK